MRLCPNKVTGLVWAGGPVGGMEYAVFQMHVCREPVGKEGHIITSSTLVFTNLRAAGEITPA